MKTFFTILGLLAVLTAGPAVAKSENIYKYVDKSGITVYTNVGSSRVDLQACKLEYSIVSPK